MSMTDHDPDLEFAICRIGRELADRSAGQAPSIFRSRWWSTSLLDLCLKDEAFKVQLFRFVDTLPSLGSDAQVATVLNEYFGDLAVPASLQWGMRMASASGLGASLSAKAIRHQVEQMAQTFIAGASIEQALPALLRLWKEGRGCSVDLLGEAIVSENEADRYRDRCLAALQNLHNAAVAWPAMPLLERDHFGVVPRVNLSVKLSALYSQLDPMDPEGAYRTVAARLRPLLDTAMALPAAITIDMEQAELKNLTLMIFMRLLSEGAYRTYPYGGIAVQAYHKESEADLNTLIQWVRSRGTPIAVRLVKGAYWDADTVRYRQRDWPVPLFEHKSDTDANYERLSRTLIRHAAVLRPVFGTHNLRTLAHAEAAVQAEGLPAHVCEYQMIYGMAEPLHAAVSQMGRRVRLYTPVGELLPGMAYLVRRLLENTSNESFLRKEYVAHESIDHLLVPPTASLSSPVVEDANIPPLESPFRNEPHRNFSEGPPRAALRAAIESVRRQFARQWPFHTSVTPSGPELISRNPSDPSEIVGRCPGYVPSDVARLVEHAQKAHGSWAVFSALHRAETLIRTAVIMRRRREELAAWEIFEVGKSWQEADADVAEAIDFFEFYAREMARLGGPRRLGHEPGELNHLVYAPRGVAAVIAPWNFPLAIPAGMVAAALVTGNAVVFKPSERSPIMGTLLADILAEAGLPDGVLQCVPGGPEVGQGLVVHPDVPIVAFTGSKAVGLRICAEAAQVDSQQRMIKRVIAEMGGKNAIIVDATADLDEAVTGVVTSFTGYQGQKCSACSRAIVHEAVYDLFLKRLADAVRSLPIGPPEDPGNRVGPLIDERARAAVRQYVEVGKREGRLVVERQADGPGYFVGPAVFADIRPEHRLAQEEIFGPVLAVMKAGDFDDAVRLANSTNYALTGGVYSRSPLNVQKARERIEVGNLYINRGITGALVGRQPFGGYRLSGIGTKAGGEGYLEQFMVARVITENTLRRGFAPPD
jgi:RHH-type transcriptional regulator, proline utilization regulon repressor / proline dehydrogenase / delta 1-pyrroline-5-carboxylate dehydrogenase